MQSSKYAVITVEIGNVFRGLGDITKINMKNYADRIGADFIVIDSFTLSEYFSEYSAYWAKLQLKEYLDIYDRIIYCDLDALILPHCPNLFKIVPEELFGALFETDYIEGGHLFKEIELFQQKVGNIGWKKEYFNVGVMIFSKFHRKVFELLPGVMCGGKYPEQTYMNYNAQKNRIKFCHLDYKYNHMPFIASEKIPNRHESYIVHYAGMLQELREIIVAVDSERFNEALPALSELEIKDHIESKLGENLSDFLQRKYELKKDKEIGLS